MKSLLGLLRRLQDPSFYIGWALVAVLALVGVYYVAGYANTLAAILMDLMMFIGLALSLAIIMSYTGYVSFGHAVFFGLGAFSVVSIFYLAGEERPLAYLAGHDHVLLLLGILTGIALSALLAGTVGAIVLRLRGAFFAIATIGLDYAVLYLEKLTYEGGEQYISPDFTYFGERTYFFFLIGTIITLVTAYLIRVSKFGYGLAAIREDEDAAEILGVDTSRYKVYAFVISAALAAMWGGLVAWRQVHVSPDYFSLGYSVDMIVMNVVGGLGTFSGPIIGAVIYYALKKITLLKIPQLALLVTGIIVVIVVSFFPEGLVGILRSKYRKLKKYFI